ncbi:MAG: hypothetical protein MRY83_20140 [Flavobacteriales bacterium]|nr:hypothetical protein [Flavobacteriales bacterium]
MNFRTLVTTLLIGLFFCSFSNESKAPGRYDYYRLSKKFVISQYKSTGNSYAIAVSINNKENGEYKEILTDMSLLSECLSVEHPIMPWLKDRLTSKAIYEIDSILFTDALTFQLKKNLDKLLYDNYNNDRFIEIQEYFKTNKINIRDSVIHLENLSSTIYTYSKVKYSQTELNKLKKEEERLRKKFEEDYFNKYGLYYAHILFNNGIITSLGLADDLHHPEKLDAIHNSIQIEKVLYYNEEN